MSSEAMRTPIETELDALFGQYTAADQSRGLVYATATADGFSHSTGFGIANDDGLLPDQDTAFPIASMTKSFVACAALVARDRGLLSLDDPITRYVPQFTATGTGDDPCDPPTLRMLLSMSGGLTEDNAWVDPFIHMDEHELLEIIGRGVRYSHLPGTVYEYSNLGYALAGLAVGRAVGQSIERFVTDEILRPLGLSSTFYDSVEPANVQQASGYSLSSEGEWTRFAPTSSVAFAGAAGIRSTVRDLSVWITWLGSAFRRQPDDDVPVLSRASRREMQAFQIVETPSLTMSSDGGLHANIAGYGLGLRVYVGLHQGTTVAHGGGLPGFLLYMLWHPESGHGVVVLTNSHRGNPSGLCEQALGRLLARDGAAAETVVLWPETVALRSQVESLIRSWDEAQAKAVFAPNVDFDRSLTARRAEIECLVQEIGPLRDPRPLGDVVSAATSADVTWSIPGERGELIVMIHLTPVQPAQVQELAVEAVPLGRPRSAAPTDISRRRAGLGVASISPYRNVRVQLP